MSIDDQQITSSSKRKYFFDLNSLRVPRSNLYMQSFLKDGMIDDWDLLEQIISHTFDCLCDKEQGPKYHPIVMSEPPINQRFKREKLCEIMFEKFQIPAFYLAKNAVLSSFAQGKATALILDCGATHTTAVPVHEGMVLQKAIVQSPLGGDFILTQLKQLLDNAGHDIVPHYMIKSRETVGPYEPPKWTMKSNLPENITDSYKKFMNKEILQDLAQTVLQISDTPYNENEISQLPRVAYEFPNGLNLDFGEERYRIPYVERTNEHDESYSTRTACFSESLFNPSIVKGGSVQLTSMLDLPRLVTNSVAMCDPDVRSSLYSNISIVGGNSYFLGLVERLHRELSPILPQAMRMKVLIPPSLNERRFSSWIGGSILASLGSFHQMWISKQEYDESGKFIIDRKCP
jgi:actin-related protein